MTNVVTDGTLKEIMNTIEQDIARDQLLNKLADNNIVSKDEVAIITAVEEQGQLKELANILLSKGDRFKELTLKVLKVSRSSITDETETDTALESAASGFTISNASTKTKILSYNDLSKDWPLKNFLSDLSEDITDDELMKLKDIMHGETGFKTSVVEKRITRPMELFRLLMTSKRIDSYNLIFLQALIRKLGRKDLNDRIRKFCLENNNKPLHFLIPEKTPENGCKYVKFHVCGGVDKLTHFHKETLRHRVANILCVPIEYVSVSGIEPCRSLLFTFMVPEDDFTAFRHMYISRGDTFIQLCLHIQVEIEKEQILFSEPGVEPETEQPDEIHHFINLLEREQYLEKQLEESNEQLFELRKLIEDTDGAVDQSRHVQEQQQLALFYKDLYAKSQKTVEPTEQKTGTPRQIPALKVASAAQLYRQLLGTAKERGTVDEDLFNKILDVKSVLETALQEERFRQMQAIIDILNMKVLELSELNSILKTTVGSGGPPAFLQEVLAIQENARNQAIEQYDSGVILGGVLQVQIVRRVYPGLQQIALRSEEQELFQNITKALSRKEKGRLKSFLDFSETETKKLKEDPSKLIELAFLKELQKGRLESPPNVILNDILAKVGRRDLVHKYLQQTELLHLKPKPLSRDKGGENVKV